MCSILGFIEKQHPADIRTVNQMNRVLRHRGPDDDGTAVLPMFGAADNNVGIGFNRLSIRDLSQAGHQPMYGGDDGSVIITFNGEIYNADQFRDELAQNGHVFRGTSDTEVLLHLYEEYGLDGMLGRIDGMFAICLIDKKQDRIYLIRDKIGEKPLYYYENESVLLWASEYKAFYEHPAFVPEIALENLTEYLMFRYISAGDTLLKHVRNVTPGTYMVIDRGGVSKIKYWDFPEPQTTQADKFAGGGISQEFERSLEKAYRSRLVSDVEIGVQLSGGVDSSCLTQYVSKAADHPLKTFGIVFEGKEYSEKKYMEQVADKCCTEAYFYDLPIDIFLKSWLLTTYFFEAPMNHEGTLGLFYLNKKASEKVKVMLCGEGADETMGGYARFYEIERCKNSLRSRAKLFLKQLIRSRTFNVSLLTKNADLDRTFIKMTQFTDDRDVRKLYPGHDCDAVLQKRRQFLKAVRGSGLRKYMNYETMTYCQDLLMRADKVSMASSLEIRVPYLMPELVELENKIPDTYFVSAEAGNYIYDTKKLLKKRSAALFGEEFTYRPKQGFGIPLQDYLSQPQAKKYIEQVLLPGIKKRGILNYEFVKETYKRKNDAGAKHQNSSDVWLLWTAFSFEIWAEMFIDQDPNKYYQDRGMRMQAEI